MSHDTLYNTFATTTIFCEKNRQVMKILTLLYIKFTLIARAPYNKHSSGNLEIKKYINSNNIQVFSRINRTHNKIIY